MKFCNQILQVTNYLSANLSPIRCKKEKYIIYNLQLDSLLILLVGELLCKRVVIKKIRRKWNKRITAR